jgi:hypothetical protein
MVLYTTNTTNINNISRSSSGNLNIENDEISPFNKYLQRLINKILNYEDNNVKLNEWIENIHYPERSNEFDYLQFNNDILKAMNTISTMIGKNKKNNVTNDILELNRNVLTYYGKYINFHIQQNIDINKFLICLKTILTTPIDDNFERLIVTFLENININVKYRNLTEIFNPNSDTLAFITYFLNIEIANDDTFFDDFIHLIKIINTSNFYQPFREFLSYDLDNIVSLLLQEKGTYMVEYNRIIDGEAIDNITFNYHLALFLKDHIDTYFIKNNIL